MLLRRNLANLRERDRTAPGHLADEFLHLPRRFSRGQTTDPCSRAYDAKDSGCSTDTKPAITPCQTMQQMASDPAYFFSDYTATGGSNSYVAASQRISVSSS